MNRSWWRQHEVARSMIEKAGHWANTQLRQVKWLRFLKNCNEWQVGKTRVVKFMIFANRWIQNGLAMVCQSGNENVVKSLLLIVWIINISTDEKSLSLASTFQFSPQKSLNIYRILPELVMSLKLWFVSFFVMSLFDNKNATIHFWIEFNIWFPVWVNEGVKNTIDYLPFCWTERSIFE